MVAVERKGEMEHCPAMAGPRRTGVVEGRDGALRRQIFAVR